MSTEVNTFPESIKDPYTGFTLTPDQTRAFFEVTERLREGTPTTLRGYAGTGKTTLVSLIIRTLVDEGRSLYATTPTHKASQVLRNTIFGLVPVSTTHSFLGLKLKPQNGRDVLIPSFDHVTPSEGIVIVDECSMVNTELFAYIQNEAHLAWLFVGDPAQLPPVHESSSATFDIEGPELTQVVRQALDNPIIAYATELRSGANPITSAQQHGITFLSKQDFLAKAIEDMSAEEGFSRESRVLAYRNKTVRKYNSYIRTARFGADAPRFVQGEILFVNKVFLDSDERPLLKNSSELIVQSFTETTASIQGVSWRVYLISALTDDGVPVTFPVLHESETRRHTQVLKTLRDDALLTRRWRPYYVLRDAFAKVDYAYALTIHKSQGSTFHNAYVDMRDIMACQGPERQALAYVATTRPRNQLFLSL